jgi:alkylation response protein AidB-like acyl-CoA dehydrogenase
VWDHRPVDFEFSDEQEQLRESVRRFLTEQAPISPYVRSMLDDDRGTTDEVWKGLVSLGVTALLVPERHGGSGPDMTSMGVVLEELGRAVHPGPFLSSAVGAVTAVSAAGAPDDQASLLPSLAVGSSLATVAIYEPDRRYEWRSPVTVARRDGAEWRVTGTKTWVADARASDTLIVLAADEAGLGLFVVDGADVERACVATVDGTRRWAQVRLDEARARRLGDEVDAAGAVEHLVDVMGTATVVDGLGAAGRALEIAVDHAKQRHQFGKPIGSFQAVQHLCADMLRDLEVARGGAYYALWACQAAPADERHRAATTAKAYASEVLPRIGEAAIQVLGGIGFTWEHDVHLFYKRLLSMAVAFGDAGSRLDELATLVIDGD